jgi:hypothetical protein
VLEDGGTSTHPLRRAGERGLRRSSPGKGSWRKGSGWGWPNRGECAGAQAVRRGRTAWRGVTAVDELGQQNLAWDLRRALIVLVDVPGMEVTWQPIRVGSIDVCPRG